MQDKIDELEGRLEELEGKFYNLKKSADFAFVIIIGALIIIIFKIF
ncbi:hypothetical protein K8Q98_01310 [Candidatus Nomurabacteria bacterium]|nr:hypothetical protein [Candidatus Nomurabacteria bacterium]